MSETIEKIVELSKLNEETFVYEKSNEFCKSAFSQVYQRAALLLKDIIRKENNYDDSVRKPIENVISFQGRRGTGKTSAMLSIQKALLNYTEVPFLDTEDVSFVVIDYIDASMLEKGEDILEMVLANMFSMLREFDSNQKQKVYVDRELYQLFDTIYGNFISIKRNKKIVDEISPLHMLTQLSNSQTLETQMRNLIKKYLEYLTGNVKYNYKKKFLVITIDDLDMHFQNEGASPYDMLETLHRYLMIPGVIILLTYNYSDLCVGCEKHFYDLFHKRHVISKEDTKHVQALAVQYLNKVLPNYTRIHMPSLRKKDYEIGGGIKIRLKYEEVEREFGESGKCLLNKIRNGTNIDLSIKRFALLLKASVAELYYDAIGGKRHFSEPLTLRELAQLYTFYKPFKEMMKNGEEDTVFKEILDDLYFRFASEKLLRGELRQLKNYLDVSIERRSRDIVQDIRRQSQNIEISKITYKGQKELSYSYGELLYGLYNASNKGWFSKELIWCILDSYTIMLTKLYRKMIQTRDLNKKRKYKQRLKEIIGVSVSSSWSNELLPKISLNEVLSGKESTVIEDNDNLLFKFKYADAIAGLSGKTRKNLPNDFAEINDLDVLSVGAMKYTAVDAKWTIALETREKANNQTLKERFQILEILCMFFTNIHYRNIIGMNKGFYIEYTNGKEDDQPQLKIHFSDGCFNIMNFVNNLFDGEEYFKQLHENMTMGYQKYFEYLENDGESIKNDLRSEVKKFFEKNSIKKEYIKWNQQSNGCALPLYSFDMMYNIFKRQFQNKRKENKVVNPTLFLNYIIQVYQGMGNWLKKEDEFYFSNVNQKIDNKDYHFYRYYHECPFLLYIDRLKTNTVLKKKFNECFVNMLLDIAQAT